MKDIATSSIHCIPIELTALIFHPKSVDEFLRFFASVDHLCCALFHLARRALPPYQRFILVQECSDMAKGEAYPLAIVRLLFRRLGLRRAFVVTNGVQPFFIRLEAHHKA